MLLSLPLIIAGIWLLLAARKPPAPAADQLRP
jgi:hypothetical protein